MQNVVFRRSKSVGGRINELWRSVGLAGGGDRGRGEHQPGPAPDDHGPGDHHAPAPAAAADHTAPPGPLAPMSSIMDKDARKRKQVSGSRATKPSLRF